MSSRFQAVRAKQSSIPLKTPNVSEEEEGSSSSHKSDESEEESEENFTDDVEEEEEEEEEAKNQIEDEGTLSKSSSSLTFLCETLCDFNGEESGDLSFTKGEMLTITGMRQDGWWEAENEDGVKGAVPSTFLKVPEKVKKYLEGAQATPEHAEKDQLWDKLRSTVKQSHYVDEALTALGALPMGFCQASLGQLLREDPRYSTEAFLAPKLSDSGISFKDLHWSSHTKSLKAIPTCLQRIIRLVAFRQIYPPGAGFDVASRHVRICLHDGAKVLSNIHTVRAKWDPKVPKIWTFTPKISSNGPSLEEGQFFLRSNTSSATIGVLFQLCVSYTKVTSGESGEMSCGWVFMRLLDDSGLAVPSRTKVLRIHSGVPFVSQQDSSLASGEKSGALKHLMNRSKHPRLVVSISTPKRSSSQQLNFLPTSLIGAISSIPLLVLYRKILADKLLRDRVSLESTELIQSPFLCNFPRIFSQPDLIDAFRMCWSEKVKSSKQAVSKDDENQKMSFQQLFTETVFLILQCCTLPSYSIGNLQSELERKVEISRIMKLVQERGPLAIAVSPGIEFHPLSISDLSLNIIGPYSFPVNGL